MGSNSSDSSAKYINMVHRLIEECMVLKMSKKECMDSLSKHANIMPVITSTVWKELEKENKEFFESYYKSISEEGSSASSSSSQTNQTSDQRIQNILLDSSEKHDKK